MVLPVSRRVSRVPRYSGPDSRDCVLPSTGLSPSPVGSSKNHSTKTQFSYSLPDLRIKPIQSFNPIPATTVILHSYGLGSFPVRSPLLGKSLTCFLFLRVLRWFTSPGSPLHVYVFNVRSSDIPRMGLPHSDIYGSKPARSSP
jgi:hypothetical protein